MPSRDAQAQNIANLNRFVEMEKLYVRQKRAGDWKAAGQTARQMVTFSQQQRMMVMLQMAAIDYVALVELNLGNFDEAIKLYQDVVDGCNRARPANAEYRRLIQVTHFNGYNGIARCYRDSGQFDEATRAFHTAIDYAQGVRQNALAASARVDLGHLFLGQGKLKEALAQFRKSAPTLRQDALQRNSSGADKNAYAGSLQGMAIAYMNLGQYNQAEPLARSAVAWVEASSGRNSTFRATSLKTVGLIYSYQNRQAEAMQVYEECVRIYREHDLLDTPRCLGVMNNLSRMYVFAGQPEKGVAMAKLVVEKRRTLSGDNPSQLIVPLTNLANVYHQLDRYDEAVPHLKEALELSQKNLSHHHPQRIEIIKLHAGNEFLRGGDKQEVIELLTNVLEMYQTVPSSPADLAGTYSTRSVVFDKLGKRKQAMEDMQESIKHAEQQRTLSSGGDRERAKLFEDYSLSYGHLLAWQIEEGVDGIDKAFTIAETMKARSFMDALHTAEFDILEDLPEEERIRARAKEKQLRNALTVAQQKYDELEDAGNEQQRQAAYGVYVARDRLYDHMVSVQNANPTHRKLITSSNQSPTLKTVQKELLQPNALLLSYAVFGTRMFVFSVQVDSIRVKEIKANKAQAKVLGIEAGALGESDLSKIFLGDQGLLSELSRPKESPTMTARLAALWEVLVPEEDRERMLDGSLELVTILPDGLLALLPFEALVVTTEGDDSQYLLDVGPPLAYAPSASVLMNLVRRPAYEKKGNREPVLTLGDPDYGQASGEASRSARFRAGLSRLPFSGKEANWVSQHFIQQGMPSISLTRGQATEARLRALVSGREIVHMACHGMAEDQYGNFFGCLALALGRRGDANDDGFLYTPEIYNLDLKGCELAILSACETNFGPQQTGEGVWTLSRGFLVSGARRVLASNWVVNDAAGATLVSYYAHELAKSPDKSRRNYAAGLQHAKQSLRKQDRWAHPFYWSSLVLVGPN